MKNKKEKLVMVLLVVGLIVMTGVISFAAFRFTQTGSVLNQITTGSITMSYTESSNVISMIGALPTTDATGKVRLNEGEYFDFTVGSSITGTANINYEIAAQELDGNTIDGKYIKYYLTSVDSVGNETEVMSPKTYTEESTENEYTGRPSNMMSLYTGSMSASTTVKYRLRLYVDESYNPQGDGGNLIYKVRVNVYGMTEVELEPGLYKEDGTFISWADLTSMEYMTLTDDCCIEEQAILTVDENGVLTSANDYGSMCSDHNLSADYLKGKLVIDDSVTKISMAFGECTGLTSVVIPDSVTILEGAFSGCTGLTSVVIPDGVTNISGAFGGCTGLTSIEIPYGVTDISGAFAGCTGLTSIEIPYGVTDISGAFAGCTGLTSIIIPDGVTYISEWGFDGCTNLISITIPNSVTAFYQYAFSDCKNLRTINYSGTQEEWNNVIVVPPAINWNYNCPEITVHCTDGDVVIPEWA